MLVKRIILTGGGSAGHVMPNIALLPELRKRGYDVHYIGSVAGIERQMISDESIPYYAIDTGKFRRYLDIRNVTDPFRVAHGLGQAALLMRRIRPHVLFAKGGFVSWPVIVAAWLNRSGRHPRVGSHGGHGQSNVRSICLESVLQFSRDG